MEMSLCSKTSQRQYVIRAVATTLSGGRMQGASTITQQLLKNNYFTTWVNEDTLRSSIDRKIQEQYLAIQLEKVTDKETILENYLNTINLGQNTLGVESASERYFNKPASELTLSEDAVIAAITQNPSNLPNGLPQHRSARLRPSPGHGRSSKCTQTACQGKRIFRFSQTA